MRVFQGMRTLVKISKYFSTTLLLLYASSTQFQPHGAELQIDLLQCWSIQERFRFDLLLVKLNNNNKKLERQRAMPRRKFDTIPGPFNGEQNAALASFCVSATQRSGHLTCFPISSFHSPSLDAWLPRQQHSGNSQQRVPGGCSKFHAWSILCNLGCVLSLLIVSLQPCADSEKLLRPTCVSFGVWDQRGKSYLYFRDVITIMFKGPY